MSKITRPPISPQLPGLLSVCKWPTERPVFITANALIGCHAIILAGVVIGEGAIVGAGAVVTKEVRPYCIVAGNPTRLIREIPPDER